MKNLQRVSTALVAGLLFLYAAFYIGPFHEEVEPQATDPEHREWILKCIENGNPRAESKPKDLVKECTFQARNLFPIRLEE